MKDEILYLISLLMIVILSAAFGYMADNQIATVINKLQNDYGDSPEECINLSLKATSYCLRDYVSSIYKYEVTQDVRKLTIEELIEEGGDCKNWAELYYDYGDELGFDVEMPIISTGDETAHTFTIISDETGYCILDQLGVYCTRLENE